MTVTTALTPSYDWSYITFYYQHGLSGLTVTQESSPTTDIDNILDRLENNYWFSTVDGLNDICFDSGSSGGYTADFVAINGHNFKSLESTSLAVTLQYSDSLDLSTPGNSGTSVAYIVSPAAGFNILPDDDYIPLIVEFDSVAARYWRLRISQLVTVGLQAPKITNAYWGQKTELDFASVAFDPTASKYVSVTNMSQTGIILGIHNKYRERTMQFNIDGADSELYDKAKTWFDDIGFYPFFVAYNYPSQGHYMRNASGSFSAPYVLPEGKYRNISFDLIGRTDSWR